MGHEAQLEWEARAARPAALAAFASAVIGLAGSIYYLSKISGSLADNVEREVFIHHHKGVLIASGVTQGIAAALLMPVLVYLNRATAYRHPETPPLARWLARYAPPLTGVLTIAAAFSQLHVANRVFSKLPLPPKAASDLIDHEAARGAPAAIGLAVFACTLAFAAAIAVNSLNARRAGLLSPFMGILGVIVGVLFVIGLFPIPLVQYFWVVALGVIFIDRWPGLGRGPAWDSGEPEPWPTAAQLRAAEEGEVRPAAPPKREASDEEAAGPRQHPSSKKRKRKRRR